MTLPGFEHIAPDFSDPIGLIRACHLRIQNNCELLEKLAEYVQQHGYDQDAIHTGNKIRQYFNVAAPLHHQDEEQNLFPLLLKHQPNNQQIIQHLSDEHPKQQALWKALDNAIIEQNTELEAICQPFIKSTLDHLQQEELHILSFADAFFSEGDLKVLGSAMQKRRQTDSSASSK